MKHQQKAIIVQTGPGKVHGLDELNIALGRGWLVAHVTPMGGAAIGSRDDAPDWCLAALVIIERSNGAMEDVLEAIQEESEEVLDDLVEGDGATIELDVEREILQSPPDALRD